MTVFDDALSQLINELSLTQGLGQPMTATQILVQQQINAIQQQDTQRMRQEVYLGVMAPGSYTEVCPQYFNVIQGAPVAFNILPTHDYDPDTTAENHTWLVERLAKEKAKEI